MVEAVTLQDVADIAGVSAKTVSRVVNGDRHVSIKTRETVDRAIAELGYRPNLAARSLVTARSFMIAMISPYLRGFYYSELHAYAQKESREHGLHLIVEEYNPDDPGNFARLEESLRQMRLDGIILSPPTADNPQVLKLIDRIGLPCVRISPGIDVHRSDAVSANERQGMTELADHFLALGHRRFGIVASPPILRSQDRGGMLTEALLARGVAQGDIAIETIDWTQPPTEAARATAARFLAAEPRPTAIFTFTDYIAMPIIQFVLERGLNVPADISIAGCDDSDIAANLWPPLTTIHQPIRELATEAVSLLTAPRADATRHLTLAMGLVVRGSTGPAPGGA